MNASRISTSCNSERFSSTSALSSTSEPNPTDMQAQALPNQVTDSRTFFCKTHLDCMCWHGLACHVHPQSCALHFLSPRMLYWESFARSQQQCQLSRVSSICAVSCDWQQRLLCPAPHLPPPSQLAAARLMKNSSKVGFLAVLNFCFFHRGSCYRSLEYIYLYIYIQGLL